MRSGAPRCFYIYTSTYLSTLFFYLCESCNILFIAVIFSPLFFCSVKHTGLHVWKALNKVYWIVLVTEDGGFEIGSIKSQKETERKSPLFDGYKQAGQHSIVIFWYSTYNSKLGHWGQPPRIKKQKTVQSIHASFKTLTQSRFFFFSLGTSSDKVFLNRFFSYAFITHTQTYWHTNKPTPRKAAIPTHTRAHAYTRTHKHSSLFSEDVYTGNPKNMLHSHKTAQAVY